MFEVVRLQRGNGVLVASEQLFQAVGEHAVQPVVVAVKGAAADAGLVA